jgi:hypothetical protein
MKKRNKKMTTRKKPGIRVNAGKAASKPKAQTLITPQHESLAAALLTQIELERGKSTLSLGTAVKGYSTRAAIMAAAPEVQVAFVRQVVAIIARMGKSKKKIDLIDAWFHDNKVPSGAEEVARQLLRRRLPFTGDMLAELFEQIGGMDFITFAPALEPLVRELEKRTAEGKLPPRIRKALPRVVKGLLVEGWSEEAADNWGLPSPADRRLAGRISMLLKRK